MAGAPKKQDAAPAQRPDFFFLLLTLALTLAFAGVALYFGAPYLQQAGGIAPGRAAAGADASVPAAIEGKDVTLDFLYADWCPHCRNMKPIVQKMIGEFPEDRFAVRYWSEADRNAGGPSAVIYSRYAAAGAFEGLYPTFVVNNGAAFRKGEMGEGAFRAWLCSQFPEPKPDNC